MPNGIDKNLVRLREVVDGFRARFGHWPERVVIYRISLDDIRALLSSEQFSAVEAKVRLLPGDEPFRAEDDRGNWYVYGTGASSDVHADDGDLFRHDDEPPEHDAWVWLGLHLWNGPPCHPHTEEAH